MSDVICILCLMGACMALALGLTRLQAAIRRIREDNATRLIRETAFAAQASAEVRR
jgi:hypothetical protein